ncbi:Formation of crista junctions protein 1 [Tulasnella sp. 417]|nr:Formation of crista junctions protein 1 [Tulasnella sp. 417]
MLGLVCLQYVSNIQQFQFHPILSRTAEQIADNALKQLATDSSAAATPGAGATSSSTVTVPKKKRFLPRFIVYSSLLGVVFYGGSTVVALNNDRYHDFFVESVPLGEAIIDSAEHDGWDEHLRGGTIRQGVDAGRITIGYLEDVFNRTFGSGASETTSAPSKAGQAAPPGSKIVKAIQESKESARSTAQTVVKKVQEDTAKVQQKVEEVKEKGKAKVNGVEIVFREDIKQLVEEVEAALAGRPYQKPTPAAPVLPDTQPPRGVEYHDPEPVETPSGLKVYDKQLPLGHQPPPGYVLPSDAKKKPKAPETRNVEGEAKPAPPPLPLVAPTVAKSAGSEPVIAQLAQSIDGLAGFLRDNPNALTGGAKDILQTAEMDLVQLGKRLEEVREDEHRKLEEKLDEQAKEYNVKLLEMEAEAQDKIDRQEEDWKSLFEDERAKIMNQYRQKLQHELETQQELINQRLKEEVIAQGIELQRRWIREIKVRVEQERGGRLAKLDDLATNVKRLERVTLDNSSYIDENVRLHSLWSAIRAVTAAVDSPKRKPFREELRVLRNVATSHPDPVIDAALDTLEASSTPDVGVEPLSDLASWFFTSVSPKVESVSLVPDQGAGLLSHIASAVLSKLRFKPRGLPEGNDVLSVLARAEYHLNEKDLDTAARELNQLTGWSKVLLKDWLDAARARLEVQQAIEVIQTQASLASLLVLETK